MASGAGWFPDPASRYSHRWWDGEQWTSRVFQPGGVLNDPAPFKPPAGLKLYCGICHLTQPKVAFGGRCRRCAQTLTRGYMASKPRVEFKGGQLVKAAQESFEAALQDVDAAIADANPAAALRHLDTAIAYGTIVRAAASSSSSKAAQQRAEPLSLAAMVEMHVHAIRMLSRCADAFSPDDFELVLLRRFALMYTPAPHEADRIPDDRPSLVAWCASRVAWAETEAPEINALAASYCAGFEWTSIRHALVQHGYAFDSARDLPGVLDREAAAALLGVDVSAGALEIKKAYYREAAKHHPDVLGDAPAAARAEAEEKMKDINAAYAALSA